MSAGAAPLTHTQALLWAGQELAGDGPLYNMITTFELRRELDVEAFGAALQALVARADALRTVVTQVDGAPARRVLPALDCPLELVDLSGEADPRASYGRWLDRRRTRTLDPGERLFDCALVRLASDAYVWYLNQHHLVTDGWSVALVFRYLGELYALAREGRLDEAPELPSYERYAEHEASTRGAAASEAAVAFYRERAAVPRDPMRLYGNAPSGRSTRSTRLHRGLGAARTRRLMEVAAEPGVRALTPAMTLFNIFLAVEFAYLYRVTGDTRLAISAPAHNRVTRTFKDTVGVFIELYPLHVDIDPDETFASLLAKVRDEAVTFVRHARPGTSSASGNRNCRATLNVINATYPAFDGTRARSCWVHSGHSDASQGMRLHVHDFDATGELVLEIDFHEEAVGTARLSEAADHLERVLDAFLASREAHIDGFDILSPDERARVLVAGEGALAPYPASATLGSRFEEAAQARPDAVALRHDADVLTYGALADRSARIACVLANRGIGRGDLVAVSLPRGIDLVATILGVLRAGAAFVPVEPDLPAARCAAMTAADAVRAVVCAGGDDDWPVRVRLDLVRERAAVDAAPPTAPEVAGAPDDLAYVLYTSGSTGEPKGVCCAHRGVLNFLADFEVRSPLAADASGSWWTAAGFDVAIYEIFSMLAFGRTLDIVPEAIRPDGAALAEWLSDRGVRSAYVPPFVLPHLLAHVRSSGSAMQLERLLVGVEPIPETLLAELDRRLPALHVINGYGPTEATVSCTLHDVRGDAAGTGPTPIGRPVQNARIRLLDAAGRLVPQGVPAELHVGGPGLAHGYLERPETTAAAFVPDPFAADAGARLYRTGDRVRQRADGAFEFIGRLDHQIKLRGHRIEPGEVESVLRDCPGVVDTVVVARDDVARGQGLVAYVVPGSASAFDRDEARRLLRERLPAYMMPATFVVLDALPLTRSGKVDRRALPSPGEPEVPTGTGPTAPRDEIEAALAAIWADVLGGRPIGIHDHFLELGGDSLLALQIAARARDLGYALAPRAIFDHPTVAELATACVPAAAAEAAARPAVPARGFEDAGLSTAELDDLLDEFGESLD